MTHSAALQGPPLNGQDIGQAEHATRAVLDRLLARTGTQFRGWVILNQLAAGGGALGEDELTGRITHGLKIGEDAVHAAAAALAWQGLISREPATDNGTRVALTPAGTARFEQIQGGIGQVTVAPVRWPARDGSGHRAPRPGHRDRARQRRAGPPSRPGPATG
jgi:hypothetical protein